MPKSKMPTKAIDIIIIFIPSIAFLILLLFPSSESSGCLGCFLKKKEDAECGNVNVIKYISDFERPNERRKICLDENSRSSSRLSKIYSGWFADDYKEDEDRFAIKKYSLKTGNGMRAYKHSVKTFRMINEKFSNEAERRLLINAVDWSAVGKGKYFPKKEAVIVMELAGADLYTYLWEERPDFTDESIRSMIRLLAKPLELFHREVGVHLDVKPANYLYDETEEFLKLNDFDGVYAFPANVPREGRANVGVQLSQFILSTKEYVSPELRIELEKKHRGVVTTKADIWSLGMSIYDVLLFQERYGLDKEELPELRSPVLFRELPLSNPPTREDTERMLKHLDSLEVLVKIWNDFPATFQLLNNLLNPDDPAARMSARGVVNFTNGGCRPKVRAAEGNSDDDDGIVLFGHVTASSLQQTLHIDPQIHGDQTIHQQKMLELQGLLAQALSKQSELMANTNYGRLPECQTN